MTLWLDYSGGAIGGAALVAAGVTGVIRYVGIGSGPKRLTQPEYDDLVAHGILVHGVAEQWTGDADGGYVAGIHNATLALADVLAITRGHGLPVVYAANDQNDHASQADVDYVHAFSDVFGHGSTGAYGFAPHIRNCFGQNVCSHFWLAGHPPSMAGLTGVVNVWQRQGTWGTMFDGDATPWQGHIEGIAIDYNNSYKDIAVTVPPAMPVAIREDDTMYILHGTDDGTNPKDIAILNGPIFMGLGAQGSGEYQSAMANIAKGALAQWVETGTYQAMDAASHALRDNPRPVTVVPPAV